MGNGWPELRNSPEAAADGVVSLLEVVGVAVDPRIRG
jgi:hypothetical protein